MTIQTFEHFFSPKSVAVVGASDRSGRVGYAVIRNLVAGGYQGRIHPINPARSKINGIKAYRDLASVGEDIDLAVIATPIESVRSVIADCAAAGIGSAIVLSAGGKETGAAGECIDKEILKAARQAPLRMIGPNCVGVISTAARLIREPSLTRAEFAIMVADALHGMGIGAALLRKLIDAAQKLGIETLVGYVLQNNTQMLRLGHQTGFNQCLNRDMSAIELAIDISSADLNAPDRDHDSLATTDATDQQLKPLQVEERRP